VIKIDIIKNIIIKNIIKIGYKKKTNKKIFLRRAIYSLDSSSSPSPLSPPFPPPLPSSSVCDGK